jgi:hypothetical protein
MAVASGSIVEHFHIIEDVCSRERACSVDLLSDSLLLEAAEERFSNGIIPTVASATHAGIELVRFAEAGPVVASVLRALV